MKISPYLEVKKKLKILITGNVISVKMQMRLGLSIIVRGKHILQRKIGPDCKCKNKCFLKVSDEEKQKILSCFNQIGNKEKQDTYIAGLIKINDVVRHRPKNNTKPKSCSCIYKVRINHVEKVVCKKSFCSFFGVGKSRVERIVKLLQKNIPSPVDRRGKHRNRGNAKDDQILFQIDTHIQSFPSRQSHYSRSKNDEVRYLSPDLNVSKMYNLYLMKYESDTWELMKNKNNSIKPTVPIIFIEIVSIQILSCLLGIHAPTHVKLAIH